MYEKKNTSCLVKALSYPKRENMALFPSSGTGIPITIRTARVSLLYRNTTFLGGCVS